MLKVKVSYFYNERCVYMVSQVGLGNSTCCMFSNPYLKDLENIVDGNNLFENMPPINNNGLQADTVTFNGQTKTAADPDGLTNCLTEKDTNVAITETGNRYKTTNKGKIFGGILGAIAPIATKLLTKGAMKFKPLAIACTALGLAGGAVGALVDSITNTRRAQAADENAVNQAQ